MSKETEFLFSETNFYPRRLQSGITDPEYLESLAWEKGIKVLNFIPTEEIRTKESVYFRNNYLERQTGLIERLRLAGEFITENNLQNPQDVKISHRNFLKGFVQDIGIFFSKTLPFSLKAKKVEIEMSDVLSRKYPHLDSKMFLTPSQPYSTFVKDLKLAEYSRGENDDFVFMFCGGNESFANTFKSRLSVEDEIRIRSDTMETRIKKGYFMMGRPDIKLLDDILVIDNTLEGWLWKGSVATAPLFHIYNLMQETILPSGSFVKKGGYTFDLKIIRENF